MSQDTGKFRKNTSDQYYTKEDVAKQCVDLLIEVCGDCSGYTWIEPSAGSGSFSNLVSGCIAFDIEPVHPNVVCQDFLEWSPEPDKKYITFGNPPFGKQSSTAKKFIKHACSFSELVAFILPRSFMKPSMTSAFPLKFHCIKSIELPANSFCVNNEEYDVPCVFQIWKRETVERKKHVKSTEIGFTFVKHTEPHTIVVRRVGVYAGRCFLAESDTFSPQSHYFIKLETGDTQKIISAFNSTTFPSNTVGPRSLSKSEIIDFLNKFTSA